jgi:glycosyltransferase involved in cell wall biosynthesis
MKRILFRASVLTQSGYGVHARQIARWLLSKKDVDVKFQALPWGDTPWILDRNSHCGLIGEIMDRTTDVNPGDHYDVTLQLQLPNEWDHTLGTFNVGMTAGVETDKCNPEWVVACNKMDAVIVPSEHVKSCLTNSGPVFKPITVIPESFVDAIKDENLPQLPSFSTDFNFLVFGQFTGNNPMNDRKNTFNTIKWMCEAFKDDPSVGIVLKTNMGRNTRIDRNVTKNTLVQYLREVRPTGFPKLHLLHGDMSDEEVASLYVHPQIKALVTLTRGEGFGLPILEAAASGLPVIATGWSGHMDFLKHGKFVNVFYHLNELHPSRVDDKIFIKGTRWANPSEDDFKKKILKFRSSHTVPRQWATEMKSVLRSTYDFNDISKMYDNLLSERIT